MESTTQTSNPLMVNYRHVPEDTKPQFEDPKGVKYCNQCNQEFGFLSGKHHCHGCGKLFCKTHCDLFLQLPDSFGYAPDTPVRVCQACFKKYNLIDFDKSYEEVGDPNAPAVVYVTGACTCRVIPPLLYDVFKGYYLLSPELPNLGSRSGEKLTDENAIETIKNLILEKVPSKKAVVFGYSMGGHLVMKFGNAHPELCHALIIGGCCNVYPPGVKSSAFFGLSAFVYDTLPNSTTCTFIQKLIPKSMTKKDVEFLMRTGMYYKAWKDCGSVMKEPEAGHYEKILATTEMPKLMIHGSKDFRSGEEVFKKAGKNLEMVVIEGADHMVMMDPLYKEQFGAKMKEFVDKIYADVNKE